MPHQIDNTGLRFGRWIVIADDKRGFRRKALCRCDCGVELRVFVHNLRRGLSRSCGCLRREITVLRERTHGMSATQPYRQWRGIVRRCTVPTDEAYPRYGGRGIRICQRWSSPDLFWMDIGPRPSTKHSVGRINNDGNYSCGKCPECAANGWTANCRWETASEQMHNMGRNVWLEWNDQRMIATDWAKTLGVSRQRMQQRIAAGYEGERLFAPAHRFAPVKGPPKPRVSKITRIGGKNLCRVCGERGHNRRTCPALNSAAA